jgi:uncharacterized membrane protein
MSSNQDLKQDPAMAYNSQKRIAGEAVRKFFWVTWIFASFLSISLAYISIGLRNGSLKTSPGWDLINSVSLIFVLYTILSVIVTHKIDERREGWGIRHAYKTLDKPAMVTETTIISAIMARQAIHIAIALGLLVVIFQNKFLVPKGDATALPDILSQFQTSIAWIVTGGFSLSVVLILVSALCYDYSCRFRWREGHRYILLRKGLELDIWAWYAFTVSLILSIALVSPLLCVLINAGYGFLLLRYYFFPYPKSQPCAIEPVS